MSETALIVRCPTCRKTVAWGPRSPERPFCSARCRQIDLGEWAAERHRIPAEPVAEWDTPEDDLSPE
ncbi:MAG: DNA gyrase inhibitor YacG [Porticoccaceae bacterium]|jgi:endogenous inhibitor of DNA gyrase (YacG/DUF329 family)